MGSGRSYKVVVVAVALIFIVSTMMQIVSSEDKNLLPMGDESEMPIPETSRAMCRKPVDVVFALDTSGSMGGTPLANLKQAAKLFVGQLTDYDRCAIFTFDFDHPQLREPYAYMTQANRSAFNATIDTFVADSWTPFYDTVGAAINYSLTYQLPERLEFVVAMTDGESNMDYTYSPKAEWGNTTAQGYQGLIKPPVMVYTIGLDIRHDSTYPTAPGWSRTPPDPVSYETEYDVWHCADSSPKLLHDAGGKYGENKTTGEDNVGHYYFTTDSNQLPNIFDIVYNYIFQISNNIPDSLDIELSNGWNLVSLPYEQNDTAIGSVLQSIDGKWDCIQTFDPLSPEHWKSTNIYRPDQLNDISTLDHTIGFWINITEPGGTTLTIAGNDTPSTLINLFAGWNLVGYPTITEKTVSDAFWGTGVDKVEVFDPAEPYRIKEVGPTYVMKPGEGYWVHVPADSVWIVDW